MRTKPLRVPAWPLRSFPPGTRGVQPDLGLDGPWSEFTPVLPDASFKIRPFPFLLSLREEAGLAFWQGMSAAQILAAKEV